MNISRRFILPPEAESILSRMTGNRTRRRRHVETLAADMREGRWVDTHEPIAMSVDGNLIDGQHRLAAVVLSGVGQWFWVAVYDTHQTAIGLPIDCGARRSTSDLLGLSPRVARIANAIYRYGITGSTSARPDQVDQIVQQSRAAIDLSIVVSPQNKRIKGSAAARAAIASNVIRFPDHQTAITEEYARWNNADPLTWNSVVILNKQIDTARSMRPEELFLRTAKAFDPRQKDKPILRLNPDDTALLQKQIRDDLVKLLFPEGIK